MENEKKGIIHIKNDHEFRRAYAKGKSFVSPVLVVYCLKRRQQCVRMGITTGKKVGNAVHRSRARRVIRESFRHLYPLVPNGWDIVFVARTKTALVKQQAVEESMRTLLKKAGLLDKNSDAQKNNTQKTEQMPAPEEC